MYFSEEDIYESIKYINITDEIKKHVTLTTFDELLVGLCPFHEEKTPSFIVDEKKQIFYCNGCGKGGNIINFLMEYYHISFAKAMYRISKIRLQSDDQCHEDKLSVKKMNEIAAELYHKNLNNDMVKKYIDKRGLTLQTLNKFNIGFSGTDKNILYETLKSKGFSDREIKISGLIYYGDNNYVQDKFTKRLMFPIQNVNGYIIGFGGRILEEKTDKKDKSVGAKYLNSPETILFDKSSNLFGMNLAKDSPEDSFILCEGYMDVIAMHQAGFGSAVASLGTAFTQKQAELIKRHKDKIILAYDSDGAGIKAAKRAIPILRSYGISIKLLEMAESKDPDEYIKKCGIDNFKQCLKNALTIEQWLFKRAFEEDNVDIMIKTE